MELFGQLPSGIPREAVVVIDALDVIAGGAEYHYEELKTLARAHIQGHSDNIVPIVAAAVGLLNTLHRLHLMLKKLPGDSDLRLARRAFQSAVKEVEPVRHHVEHLDERVTNPIFATQGAFGALSWWHEVDDERLLSVVIPGHVVEGVQVITRVPAQMREDIDHIWIVINDSIFDISDTYWAMRKLAERLREWAAVQREQGWPTLAKHQRPRRT